MSPERPLHQATNDFERASKAMNAERELLADAHEGTDSTHSDEALTNSIRGYQEVQKQIIELEGNLKRSMDDAVAARADNPARADLLTTISKAITKDIEGQQAVKTKFESDIRAAGDDPTKYILQ